MSNGIILDADDIKKILAEKFGVDEKEHFMNDIETMPGKCHDCPYWEICAPPYVCGNTRS